MCDDSEQKTLMEPRWQDEAKSLLERYQEAENNFPGLMLEIIQLFPVRKITQKKLKTLIPQWFGAPPEVEWVFLPTNLIARFHGSLSGLNEFQKLGQDSFNWLRATDPELPKNGSYCGWIQMLYTMTSNCPCTGFETNANPKGVNFPADAKTNFHSRTTYNHSLFEISSAALKMFLDPYHTQFLKAYSSKIYLFPWQLACVFANPKVLRLTPKDFADSGLKNAMAVVQRSDPFKRPRFFKGANFNGNLDLAGKRILKLKAGSKLISRILEEFQKHHWIEEIDTPRSIGRDPGPAGREFKRKMNKRQEQIIFTALDSGKKIQWRLRSDDDE